jgi:hypothetical protein
MSKLHSQRTNLTAEEKADRERTQMRAIATAYDDLGTASAGAARDMAHPLAEIRTIFQHYVVSPVTVADDWTVDGVEDWNSEAGMQLSRLAGLVSTLESSDAQWGANIAQANQELDAMAPESVLTEATKTIEDDKKQDSRSNPDRLRTSAAAFQQIFGRAPSSPTDWKTAEALNPNSYDPNIRACHRISRSRASSRSPAREWFALLPSSLLSRCST